jgi:hypothetical protein
LARGLEVGVVRRLVSLVTPKTSPIIHTECLGRVALITLLC